MIRTVLSLKRVSSALVICSSEKESSALVGSSSRIISGFFRKILAMASRCFCPQLSLTHLSQISVSRPLSRSNTKSHCASLRASMSCCSSISRLCFDVLCFVFFSWVFESEEIRFSLIVASKTQGSCVRYPM